MLRTLRFKVFFVLSLLVTGMILPIWHLLGWVGLGKYRPVVSHYTSFYWARFMSLVVGMKVKVIGLNHVPREGPVLFVSNHQGNFDIAAILGFINKPKGFLAKIELSRVPVIHSWMEKMDCVFIDRLNLRQSIKAVQKCVEVLNSGQSMVIFPEGTRSKGPQMGDFKKGSLRLVEKVNVPIIPVSVSGTYKIMEAEPGRIFPAEVTLKISEPIYYFSLSKEEQDKINEIVRDKIESNLEPDV